MGGYFLGTNFSNPPARTWIKNARKNTYYFATTTMTMTTMLHAPPGADERAASKVITGKIGWRDSQIGRWPLGCSIVQTRLRRNEIWFCRAISRPNQPPLSPLKLLHRPLHPVPPSLPPSLHRASGRRAHAIPESGGSGARTGRGEGNATERVVSRNLVKSRTLAVLASLNAQEHLSGASSAPL